MHRLSLKKKSFTNWFDFKNYATQGQNKYRSCQTKIQRLNKKRLPQCKLNIDTYY